RRARGPVGLDGGGVPGERGGSGRGAAFVVRLPRAGRGGPRPEEDAPPLGARRRRRVLVIDDDRDVTSGLKRALEMGGHEVAVAYDGVQGLETARAFRPHLVLCDIRMPGIDGHEAARAFPADPQLRDILLVALPGYAQAVDRDKARETGFDEHLAKPADMARIQALLGGVA